MKLIKLQYIMFAILLVISGCRKDERIDEPVKIGGPGETTVEVVSGVTGFVTNENGSPLRGAKVTVYNQEVTTDENGVFYVNNIGLRQSGTMVKVELGNYFDGFKTIKPSLGGKSFVQIKMISNVQSDNFHSSEGGNITLNGGASIFIPPNSVVKEDGGEPYEGLVSLKSHWYDPTDKEVGQSMPGNLLGLTKEGIEVQLGTYGMIAVEFGTVNSESFQLAPEAKAILKFPVSDALEPSATVPLWSFDEIEGVWIEEGEAVYEDGFYVAEVSHFSFWNCDAPFPLVNITGMITNLDFPVANMQVEISATNLSAAFGYTDNEGIFRGKVPKGENLVLTISHCGEVLSSKDISPLESDTDLGEIEIELLNFILSIEGRMVDCFNQPVENAYGVVRSGERVSQIVTPKSDGTFKTVITGCNNEFYTLELINLEELQSSDIIKLDQNLESVNFEDVMICQEIPEFLKLTKEGEESLFFNSFLKVYLANEEDLIIRAFTPNVFLYLDLKADDVGQFTPYNIRIEDGPDFGIKDISGCGYSESELFSCDNFEVNITRFDTYVEGSFSGFIGENLDRNNLDNTEYNEHFYTGEFRLSIDDYISTGEISGNLWFDENGNDLRDDDENSETPVMNVSLSGDAPNQLSLYQPVIYLIDGTYRFINVVPGDYRVFIFGKSGYTAVTKNVGSNDRDSDFEVTNNGSFVSDQVTVEFNNIIENVDLGFEIPDSVICGPLVFEGCSPNIIVSTTISSGLPPFQARINGSDLVSVENTVSFTVPEGGDYTIDVFDSRDNSCRSSGFVQNFASNQIEGIVWRDENISSPNIFDPNEQGINNINVQLLGVDGQIVTETTTVEGNYIFENVSPGDYFIFVEVPNEYTIVEQNVDIDGGSDIDTVSGRSELFLIEACNSTFRIDAGLKLN